MNGLMPLLLSGLVITAEPDERMSLAPSFCLSFSLSLCLTCLCPFAFAPFCHEMTQQELPHQTQSLNLELPNLENHEPDKSVYYKLSRLKFSVTAAQNGLRHEKKKNPDKAIFRTGKRLDRNLREHPNSQLGHEKVSNMHQENTD